MNFFGHLTTVMKHRRMVIYHAFKVGIPMRGILHDLSKYSPSEFFCGVKYYTDGSRSPNEAEREDKGYSAAWMHHKGRNKHHFEYWVDFNTKEKLYVTVEIKQSKNSREINASVNFYFSLSVRQNNL